MLSPKRASPASEYRQHHPEQTALYRLVAEHLEGFLDHVREHHTSALPKYVEEELRAYLRCGVHACGFLRARCKNCRRELLVAFSYKRRGVCPSCNARRMCGTAALLTDQVLPEVPLRQWVLSVPFDLRLLLARDPSALSAVGGIFVHEILRWQRERANFGGTRRSRGGAICFPQRFGGSLNLNVHYHVAAPDGVFTLAPGSERAQFHRLAPPRADDLDGIAFNVEMRSLAWLRRRGLLAGAPASADCSDGASAPTALDACLAGSLGVGELTALDARSPATPDRHSGRAPGWRHHSAKNRRSRAGDPPPSEIDVTVPGSLSVDFPSQPLGE